MSSATDAIKTCVTVRQAAQKYGMAFDRYGWARCPLHSDRRPSLRLYDGSKGWHCFQCKAGGSVIDLVMALYGITCDQAVVRINHDFDLRLPIGRKPTARERMEAERQARAFWKARKEAERAAYRAEETFLNAFSDWLTLARIVDQHRPASPSDEFDPLWAFAQQNMPDAYDRAQRADCERVDAWNTYRQTSRT